MATKKPLTFSEQLAKKIEKENKRRQANHDAYAQECKRQGVEVGQPISLMDMIKIEGFISSIEIKE